MSLHRTPFPVRLARHVVLDVRQGSELPTAAARKVLADLGRQDPELLAELVVEIARLVDDEVVARITADRIDTDVPEAVAREAHRLHWLGVRIPWVVWGEALYYGLRNMRRKQRSA